MCQYTLLNLCEFINQITSCEWNSCSLKGVIELHCVCIERTKINLKLTCFYIIISVAVKISSKIACACYCVTAHTCHVTRINSYRYIFLYRIWWESRGQALNWNNNFGSSHIMRDWQLWQWDARQCDLLIIQNTNIPLEVSGDLLISRAMRLCRCSTIASLIIVRWRIIRSLSWRMVSGRLSNSAVADQRK